MELFWEIFLFHFVFIGIQKKTFTKEKILFPVHRKCKRELRTWWCMVQIDETRRDKFFGTRHSRTVRYLSPRVILGSTNCTLVSLDVYWDRGNTFNGDLKNQKGRPQSVSNMSSLLGKDDIGQTWGLGVLGSCLLLPRTKCGTSRPHQTCTVIRLHWKKFWGPSSR